MRFLQRVFKVFVAALLALTMLSGCVQGAFGPIKETYQYSTKSKNYVQPAVVDGWVKKDALTTTNEDGRFFCFTADTAQADDFINAQRTLVRFLRQSGIQVGQTEYYGTDYSYSFSLSEDNAAYISLSDVRSWQQVLVTLQALWGDYTDYGYVYAMSNAIAEELEWQTDFVPAMDKTAMDTFFSQNPAAVQLLYPSFTTEFASEETVQNSKALANNLLAKLDWHAALKRPVVTQLEEYYKLVSGYATEIAVSFTRQSCGYAYYGENVPLRIMTTYAELIIDGDYADEQFGIYGNYFSDYTSIYQTANIINSEITEAVEYFELEEKVGVLQIKWLNRNDSHTTRFTGNHMGMYYSSTRIAYVTSIQPYLHEYYHHIEHKINPNLGRCWQSEAFSEMGEAKSDYALHRMEKLFTEGQRAELFYAFTGRDYQAGRNDYYEVFDILCYIDSAYVLSYNSGAASLNSIGRYLIALYGEDVVYDLLLFPETVEASTGKTWDTLIAEWKQHLQDKYSGVELPDWLTH